MYITVLVESNIIELCWAKSKLTVHGIVYILQQKFVISRNEYTWSNIYETKTEKQMIHAFALSRESVTTKIHPEMVIVFSYSFVLFFDSDNLYNGNNKLNMSPFIIGKLKQPMADA